MNRMPTRRYDHHRLSPLVSTRNDEGPKRLGHKLVNRCIGYLKLKAETL